jgi:hypothetical protein
LALRVPGSLSAIGLSRISRLASVENWLDVWKFNVQLNDEGFLSSHHVRGKPSPGRFLPECPMVP